MNTSGNVKDTVFGAWSTNILNGSLQSENELCRYLQGKASQWFVNKGYDQNIIEDAEQEAFISLLNTLRTGRLRSVEALEGYYFNSVRYQIWHHIKQSRRMDSIDDGFVQWEDPKDQDCFDVIASRKQLEEVINSIQRLKVERDRDLFIQHFFLENSVEQLCERYSINRDHFYRILHRARKRLANTIDDRLKIAA